MKTNEEPNAIKNETETVTKKLPELTDEDLEQVTGGDVRVHNSHPCTRLRRCAGDPVKIAQCQESNCPHGYK